MNRKKQRGITLIVLIFTVIILLILTGLSIGIITNKNIIGKAKNIVNESNSKTIADIDQREQIYEDYNNKTGKPTKSSTGNGKVHAGSRAKKTAEYEDENGNVAVIPAGFTVSKIPGETSINGGLVIYDIPDGTEVDWGNPDSLKTVYNQFVWIPVEFTKTEGANYQNDPVFEAVWQRSAWENNARAANPTLLSLPNSTEWDYFTEPYSFSSSNFDETGTGIKAELDAMKKSVCKYEGFYVARYEAGYVDSNGVNTIRTSSSMEATIPVFRQDAYPYNYVCWGDPSKTGSANNYSMGHISEYGVVYLSSNISYKSGSTAVTSMLCSGVAWDAMLDFVKDSNHDVTNSMRWGNYNNASFTVNRQAAIEWKGSNLTENNGTYTKMANTSVLLTTGASEQNKAKNIYDIAGNCYEWTTESSHSTYRVARGNSFYDDGSLLPASHRYSDVPCNSYDNISFRAILYINI